MAEILKNPVVTGVGGAVAGLAVGALLSLSTIDAKIGASIDEAMDGIAALVAGEEAAMDGVTARLEALEEAVEVSSGAVAALDETVSDQAGAVATLAERMPGDLGADLGARISALEARIDTAAADLGSTIADTATAQTETLRAALQAQPAPAPAPETETTSAETDGAEDASRVALPEGLRMEGEARGVGETFVLADGSVRAFVQRADAQAGRAQLSVNRVSSDLAVGETVVVSHAGGACRVGVAAVTGAGVRIGSDCNTPAEGAALGDAYAPGNLAMLADGQLRVFVSGIFGDEARLAINGLETRRVRVGDTQSVTMGEASCSVTVNGIRGNSVLLTGGCA
ncbi:hypothetical protein [Roseovarius sp. D22-M7]|uniref:hypothetical protein n=1 Tax=Roseovarius sp. D22-M7 TaxID=3127116 RepID=UPI00300F9C5A